MNRIALYTAVALLALSFSPAQASEKQIPREPGSAPVETAIDTGAVPASESVTHEQAPEEAASDENPGDSDRAAVSAASHETDLPAQDWGFSGPFGTFDRAALQRGFQVYSQVCSSCHAMKHLYYRDLADLGYTEAEIKAIASQASVTDGPNEEGEMFERPAKPSDRFKSPFANDEAAKYANNGALPPDLSMIVKARPNGADHVYGILTGYAEAPAGVTLQNGQHYNKYMPGHIIAMAPPLAEGMVGYGDNSPTTVDQYASDLVEFLTWASEPSMEHRKQMGVKVVLFLMAFAAVMYGVKKKLWSRIH